MHVERATYRSSNRLRAVASAQRVTFVAAERRDGGRERLVHLIAALALVDVAHPGRRRIALRALELVLESRARRAKERVLRERHRDGLVRVALAGAVRARVGHGHRAGAAQHAARTHARREGAAVSHRRAAAATAHDDGDDGEREEDDSVKRKEGDDGGKPSPNFGQDLGDGV